MRNNVISNFQIGGWHDRGRRENKSLRIPKTNLEDGRVTVIVVIYYHS